MLKSAILRWVPLYTRPQNRPRTIGTIYTHPLTLIGGHKLWFLFHNYEQVLLAIPLQNQGNKKGKNWMATYWPPILKKQAFL